MLLVFLKLHIRYEKVDTRSLDLLMHQKRRDENITDFQFICCLLLNSSSCLFIWKTMDDNCIVLTYVLFESDLSEVLSLKGYVVTKMPIVCDG